LVTANAPEAEVLTGARVTRLEEARRAAETLLTFGPRAALVKGGHIAGDRAADVLALDDGGTTRIVELRAARLRLPPIHGGGCILASLVAARLAAAKKIGPEAIEAAVRWAKKAHHKALSAPDDVGGDMRVLLA
jgi:hydroxymethylpyrimidine/phosphomethylpyrimidine kinase